MYGITLDDTVCRPCRDDLRRIVAHHDLQPRWEKVKQCKCCVRDCTEDCFAHSKVIDSDVMNRLFECTDSASIPFPTPLCARHYRLAYNAMQPRQRSCPTCGISFRHAITRACPNAAIIQEHLTKTIGFNRSNAGPVS